MKMPIIDKIARRVTLKEQVVDFAPQPVITKDNVSVCLWDDLDCAADNNDRNEY